MVNSIVKGGDWVVFGIKYGVFFLKRKGLDFLGSGEGRVSFCMMKWM